MYKLDSQTKLTHSIKGSKEYTDKIRDGAQNTALLCEYCLKYGHEALIHQLISAYSSLRGGISFNQAKSDLSHEVEQYNTK